MLFMLGLPYKQKKKKKRQSVDSMLSVDMAGSFDEDVHCLNFLKTDAISLSPSSQYSIQFLTFLFINFFFFFFFFFIFWGKGVYHKMEDIGSK